MGPRISKQTKQSTDSFMNRNNLKRSEKFNDSLYIKFPLTPVIDDESYEIAKGNLNIFLDQCNGKTSHIDILYIKELGSQIELYEKNKYKFAEVSGTELLKFLMEQNNLTQYDFENEIGSQGNVSKILSGERKLSLDHIKRLAKRFNLSADAFIGS